MSDGPGMTGRDYGSDHDLINTPTMTESDEPVGLWGYADFGLAESVAFRPCYR